MRLTILRISALALPLLAGVMAWVAATQVPNVLATNVAKGSFVVFTALIGFAMFMLREVQQINFSGVLSDLGIQKLRRVRGVAQKRTLLLIGIGAIGIAAASFTTFLPSDNAWIRGMSFAVASWALVVLFVSSVVYLPMLFLDLQSARDKLEDLVAGDALRKRQIDALSAPDRSRGGV